MRTGLFIRRNKEMGQQSIQKYISLYNDLIEKNRQFQVLNEQLLKEKEKLEERDRLKSAFLANIVHEICTPISAIKGFAELLQTPDLIEKNKIKYAQIITQCADNMLNLVHDLLDTSKIEAGQLTIIERPGNLRDLFNELFELFNNPTIQRKSGMVQLKSYLELTQEQCLIDADFIRLRQVLINLISNALKFTEKGHVIFGCCLIDPKTLCFSVEDTGIGIAPEKQDIIFERFRQLNDPNLANRCKGTGLGLSIVKSLVGLMNGEVWVDSTQNIGSTFYFTLPYKKSTIPKAITKNNVSYNWSDKNILIVEDDDFEISLMSKYLSESNANCFYAKDSKSALESVKSNSTLDLVIMNIQLPGINGFDLVREIKKIAPYLHIIAQTESGNPKDNVMALSFDCNCISKPINIEYLLKLIQDQFTIKKTALLTR